VKKVTLQIIIFELLILLLLVTSIVHSAEVGQKDLNYQLKVFPIYMELNKQYNTISSLNWEIIENPSIDLGIEVCDRSKISYKVLRKLSRKRAITAPGKLFQKFNIVLVGFFAMRNAALLLFIQACGLDPSFENPEVWNSFEQRWSVLDKQSVDAHSMLEEELRNIEKSIQE